MVHEYFQTFILSQIFGVYMVIMAIILASRSKYYKNLLNHLNPNGIGVLLSGSMGLLLGLFLVTIHSFWDRHFVVDLLSIFLWFILIKSILILSFPEKVISLSQRLYSGNGYYIMVLIMAIVGIILMTNGYYLYM
ncbi:hypothetical protein [Legionella maioricensis]|uniref:Integral membrane protein (PIN domain superfamily) n=1 Tax=Legionella maioricensis TaxID=2896528 RepID=A0A9X2IB63_9GAMM|nr:hypothetical protein [Legionella maioricensis]MCL9683976.1 hypothetical protein [Legionella maioricensis]MCL9687979.1 hypothetical protein [Legionella maioricensis]